VLTDADLTNIINDAYKDIMAKCFCYEVKETLTLIDGNKIYRVPMTTANAIRTTYIEHDGDGIMQIPPTAVGYADATVTSGKGTPLYWFQWGEYLVFEPTPNSTAAGNTTNVYNACYPAAVLSSDFTNLPAEFHEDVVEFALAFANLKLKRWGDAALHYNAYIASVQRKRFDYVYKVADVRTQRILPDSVTLEIKGKE